MRVLVATDASEDAQAAVEWLLAFPLPDSTRVCAIAAAMLPRSAVDAPPVLAFRRALLAAARHAADDARARLQTRWQDAEARWVGGDPRDVIVRMAEEWPADLVVLGARGLNPFKAFLLGRISSAVVQHAPCPVLVVKGRPTTLRSAVVAVDGSPDSMAALRFFEALPLSRALRLRLLAVAEPALLPVVGPEMPAALAIGVSGVLLTEQRRQLQELLGRLGDALGTRVPAVEASVVVGRPAEEILVAASEPGVDLVVGGARGLGRVARLVMGSVSRRVLEHADCSVLVVREAVASTRD